MCMSIVVARRQRSGLSLWRSPAMPGLLHGKWVTCYAWYERTSRNSWRLGVAFLTRAGTADIRVRDVSVTEDELSVGLMDGRTITVPLAWYPRLADATPAQRAHWEVSGAGYGIHWPDVDEDLSTDPRSGSSLIANADQTG